MSWTAIIPVLGRLLERLIPDPAQADEAKLKLAELAQQGALAELEAEVKVQLGQLEINKEEARHGHWMVAGWRPAIGWVCAISLLWAYVLHPSLQWLATLAGTDIILPTPELSTLLTILGTLLGVGSLRTIDKVMKVDTRRITTTD